MGGHQKGTHYPMTSEVNPKEVKQFATFARQNCLETWTFCGFLNDMKSRKNTLLIEIFVVKLEWRRIMNLDDVSCGGNGGL